MQGVFIFSYISTYIILYIYIYGLIYKYGSLKTSKIKKKTIKKEHFTIWEKF